jgi:oxygen-independent coproporphyrinogen-3 oxidase
MAGIYIHIPFCKQKCTYCDFHFSTNYQHYQNEMINALVSELEIRKNELAGQRIETIYFGGGTPSLIAPAELQQLIDTVHLHYDCQPEIECTLEANPDDIDATAISQWKAAGINRLSIGIQSFDDRDLSWMNRAHSAAQSLECIRLAHAGGILNCSIDLIYGLPDMDNTRWLEQIHTALSLEASHISAYCLTVEEKTALYRQVQQKKVHVASNEQQSEQFDLLIETLAEAGYEQYEISNFARAGFISRHNSNYWKGIHYVGIGPSAHSFNGKQRAWNIANNAQYMRLIQGGEKWFETENLSDINQFNELILTGLRTKWGVNLTALAEIISLDKTFYGQIEQFIAKKWMVQQADQVILTSEGKHWADAIAQDLFL